MTRGNRLAQLELDCMKVLWRQPGATVAQVRAGLDRPLAYTTVMTVLDRMASKGVVTRHKNGRAWLYAAELDRESARGEAISQLLANLFDNDRAALLEYISSRREVRRPAAAQPAWKRATSPAPSRGRVARPPSAGPVRRPSRKAPSFAPSSMDEFLL